jgi:Holliday junction resolvasome RuvABC endonuclease subunit
VPMPALAPGGVLALDLSRSTGWCYGAVGDRSPAFGVWHLPHTGGEGARYAAFENVLAAAMDAWAPGKLVLEAAFSLQALANASNIAVARQQLTLRGIAYAEAWRASVPIVEIDSFTVRSEVLGRGRFAKETVKREVVQFCRARGWKVPDHNAGDACLVWLWLTNRLRGRPPVAGPLFLKAIA